MTGQVIASFSPSIRKIHSMPEVDERQRERRERREGSGMPSHRQKGLRDRDRGGSFFRTGAKRGVAQAEGEGKGARVFHQSSKALSRWRFGSWVSVYQSCSPKTMPIPQAQAFVTRSLIYTATQLYLEGFRLRFSVHFATLAPRLNLRIETERPSPASYSRRSSIRPEQAATLAIATT